MKQSGGLGYLKGVKNIEKKGGGVEEKGETKKRVEQGLGDVGGRKGGGGGGGGGGILRDLHECALGNHNNVLKGADYSKRGGGGVPDLESIIEMGRGQGGEGFLRGGLAKGVSLSGETSGPRM